MIKGELVFTAGVRAYAVSAARRQARLLRERAERCDALAVRLADARTTEDLRAISADRYEAQGTHMSEDYQELTRGHTNLDNYHSDYRSTCSYCGKKVHGGVGMTLLGRHVFACTADACDRRFERELAKDKKLHPRRWAKKKAARRGDRIRRSRRYRHGKPNPKRTRRDSPKPSTRWARKKPLRRGDQHVRDRKKSR